MFGIVTKRIAKLFGTTKTVAPRQRHAFRPLLEGLEDRMLMAGNIAVRLDAVGSLVVTEANRHAGRDQAVQINRLASGKIRVEGIATANGTKSLVNGKSFQDFTVKNMLFVQLGNGRDKLVIGNNSYGKSISFSGTSWYAVSIDMGSDNFTGAGDKDSVSISHLKVNDAKSGDIYPGALRINTGAGDDRVTIEYSNLTTAASINMGRGDDTFEIRSRVQATQAHSLAVSMDPSRGGLRADDFGKDTVFIDNLTLKYSMIVDTDPPYFSTGAPNEASGINDSITMSHVTAGTDIYVRTYGGLDTVRMYYMSAVKSINVNLGYGDDTLSMLHSRADLIEAEAENGIDTLAQNDNSPGHTNFMSFEIIQNFNLPNLPVSGLTLASL